MKLKKASHLILFISSLITILFLFLLLTINLTTTSDLTWQTIVILTSGFSIIIYLIVRYFIGILIINRLNVLIKNVYSNTKQEQFFDPKKHMDTLIDDIELELENWESDKLKEIDKLREQESFRREFLGNLSHELKTPIFSIQGYLLTLLEGGLDDPAVNKLFVERASKATERMARIIEDLDQITKIEADNFRLDIRPFDIVELVRDIFESLELDAIKKEITLKLEQDYNSIFVDADRNKISQVLTNLLVNSIFYGNSKGTSTVSLNQIDEMVLVSVIDDGPGIEEIHIHRLFERFYRVEKSRNRNEGGSGLGLAIVKHLLEAHGQSITVKSTVGKGSTFSFGLNKSKNSSGVLLSSRGIPI
jgi:two-component system phosphate regulon sensor histidine kinase PhoR